MTSIDYIGFDIHKKTISFCAKARDGEILDEGLIPARRADLDAWAKKRPRPWVGAMEATLFTGWLYDHLKTAGAGVDGGAPADDESYRGIKKQERQGGRAQGGGPDALRSAAGMLHGAECDPETAAGAALSQPGGASGDG